MTVENIREKTAVDTNCLHGHLGAGNYSAYRNLVFTDSGWARLWATIGYFQGCGAEKCLEKLHERLEYLNTYGGEHQGCPAYRVVLRDDGCWGSFGLAWYRSISNKEIHAYAEAEGIKYSEALDALKVDQDLKVFRGAEGYMHYRYSFFGGLIWHWNQDVLDGSYGIHT